VSALHVPHLAYRNSGCAFTDRNLSSHRALHRHVYRRPTRCKRDERRHHEKMTEEQRYAYLAGLAEGLAYAHYASDHKQTDAMQCTGSLTTIRRSRSQSMLHSTNIPIARPAQLSRCWRARSATRVHDRRRASNCLCSKHFSRTRKRAAAQNSRSRSIRGKRRDEERRASRMSEKTSTPF
jgi:hypothetical protein